MSLPELAAETVSNESVLQEAERLINGERRGEYGDVVKSFEDVATGWSLIIGTKVTAVEVALCMTWLKTMREVNKHKRDNLTDLAGYTGLAAQIADFLDSQQQEGDKR